MKECIDAGLENGHHRFASDLHASSSEESDARERATRSDRYVEDRLGAGTRVDPNARRPRAFMRSRTNDVLGSYGGFSSRFHVNAESLELLVDASANEGNLGIIASDDDLGDA